MISHDIDPLLLQLNNKLSLTKREEIRQQLSSCITYLLVHDFARLVQALYRADVSEQKLKQLLQQQPGTDAAVLIADLFIQRQEEKIRNKGSFPYNNDISEEERW